MFDHLNPYFSQDKSSSLNPLSFPDKPSDWQFEKNPHQSKFSESEPYLKYIFCSKTAIFKWLTPHFPGFPGQSPVVPGGPRWHPRATRCAPPWHRPPARAAGWGRRRQRPPGRRPRRGSAPWRNVDAHCRDILCIILCIYIYIYMMMIYYRYSIHIVYNSLYIIYIHTLYIYIYIILQIYVDNEMDWLIYIYCDW